MPQTILAFDFGLARIGVAVGQTITRTAQPLTILKARDGIPRWEEIAHLIQEWGANYLVVGLPLNMDDSDNEITLCARKFANRLKEKFQLPVDLMDERLSTVSAKSELEDSGRNVNFQVVDAIAAQLILETWLHENVN